MSAIRDMARAMASDPDQATRRQRIAGCVLLVAFFIALGFVPS